MDEYSKRLIADRVILRAFYTLVPAGIVGVGFLVLSRYAVEWNRPILSDVLREIGVVLFVTSVLTLAWELIGKRALADEILAKANMSRDLADAGIEVVTPTFMDNRIAWDELFKNSNRLDIWVSYANTWRNSHAQMIEKLLSRKDARFRVVLPDPEDEQVMEVLSQRFKMTTDVLKGQIQEARDAFGKFGKYGNVEIYLSKILPVFTMYIFTSKAILAFYNHRKGRIPVPTFVCDEDGFIFRYLSEEFEDIIATAQKYTQPTDV